jgi:adenylate cyclase class 2
MQTEIEAKWLNIDLALMRRKLLAVGAELVAKERLMTRKVYDYPDKRLEKIGGWVRVRDEGNKITLSYKQLNDRTVHGTKEVTVIVDTFAATCSFLDSIGMKSNSFQETKRESWKLGNAEIELDTWPWIPSFLEIEAKNEEELKNTAKKLDLEYSKALHGSVETAYQAVYDVTEEEIDNWEEIRFIEVPKWLASKTRKH